MDALRKSLATSARGGAKSRKPSQREMLMAIPGKGEGRAKPAAR
jgi:hypothetical protein